MNREAIASALAAALLVTPAAAVNLEYGQDYEFAYLEQCEVENSARSCRCSMEALQTQIGFEAFAERVERLRDRLFDQAEMTTEVRDLLARCTAIGSTQ